MKDRRKTDNPYARLADRPGKSPNMYTAWADGYKCGHNDGEMDEREAGDQVRKEEIRLRGMVMDKSAEVRMLEHGAKFLRATIKNLQAKNRTANDTIGMLRDADAYQQAWTAGYEHGIAQCNHHPEATTNEEFFIIVNAARSGGFDAGNEEGYADGLAEGKRQLEGLGEVGYDAGFIKGREAGKHQAYTTDELAALEKRGFEEGRKYGLRDWMMHFILYMQESGESFAVCQLSDLEDMREAVRKATWSADSVSDIGTHLEEIENVLTKLEVVDR